MIVILLGSPGCGKGTQSRILSAKYGFTHLATGDIFRNEMAAKTTLGLKAAEYVKSGKLVPDSIVTEMVAGRLNLNEADYLLDGFPRNLDQAQALNTVLSSNKRSINLAVFLNLSRAEASKRLVSRQVCSSCGEVFNLVTRPPAVSGQCDRCGASLATRDDDKEATVAKRIMIFEDLTQPLVAYYKAEGVFREIDAAQNMEKVTTDLCAAIESIKVRS